MLLMLCIISGLSLWSMVQLISTERRTAHTQRTIKEIRDVPFILSVMESGRRGYIITGDNRYLESFTTAYATLDKEFNDIRDAVARNPQQLERLNTLEPLIHEKGELLKESIDLRKTSRGNREAQKYFTNKGKELMDTVIKQMDIIERSEENSLERRRARAEFIGKGTMGILILLGFLSIFLVACATFIISRDIRERIRAEREREKLIAELEDALTKIKTLSGLLPICSSCKKIRDDKGYWHALEEYIKEHSSAEFTHGICPECVEKLYPRLHKENKRVSH